MGSPRSLPALGKADGTFELSRSPYTSGAPDRVQRAARPPRSQAHKSDPRENAWHKKVCNGTLTLKQARKAELAYKRAHG